MADFFVELFKGIASVFIYGWWFFALVLGFLAYQNKRKTKWVAAQENLVLEIKIPKTNDKNPTAAEMMFATLHGILRPRTEIVKEGAIQEHVSFEIASDMDSINFYVWTPRHLKDFIEGQIYAQYPSAEITVVEDYTKKVSERDLHENKKHISCAELMLEKADYLPIKTFANFQVDPLAAITGVLSKIEEEGEEIWIQILARPVSDEWKQKGLNWIAKKKGGQKTFELSVENIVTAPFKLLAEMIRMMILGPSELKEGKSLSAEDESRVSAIEQKSEKLGFAVKIRVLYLADSNAKASEKMNSVFGAFKQYNSTNLNGFRGRKISDRDDFLAEFQNRIFLGTGYHLNIEELASIYHMPHTSVETPNIKWTTFKTGEPPTELPTAKNTPEDEITLFAETNFRSNRLQFGIKRDDRRRHMYIIGKSGMGKTKLLENLANHDIKKGEGVAIIDPHGDYISDILKKIPAERAKDVILFDPADVNYPIAFNPMEVTDEHMKVQIAAGVVGTFKKIFGFSWGPRLEYVLNYTVLALLDTEGTTLLGIVNMLTDKNYRKMIVGNIKDPVVKKFWTTEFASYSEKFATEAIAPILNKVGQFVANSLIRNVIGQPKSSFSIRKSMDEGKIVLINLSTGRVGETNAALLGSLMITAIQLAAMSRADIPEEKRKDFYLYVDEFQNFATDSFAVILSEARKYRLSLIMANQYISQMEDVVREAVFGNVGTMITFRVGAGDASVLEKEFNPPFVSQDLINLPRQHIYARMTINGQSETAFSAKTLNVTDETTGIAEQIIQFSRDNYTKPKETVEGIVAKSAGINMDEPASASISEVIREEVKAANEAIEEGESLEDFEFEAPIVKKLGKGKTEKVNVDKDALKEAIKSNTAPKKITNQSIVEELEQTADYIVRHSDGDDKYVFLPQNKPENIIPDKKKRQKGGVYEKSGRQIYKVMIDMFQPKKGDFKENKEPDIWVGTLDEMLEQLKAISNGEGGGTKFLGIEDKTKHPEKLIKKLQKETGKLNGTGTQEGKIKDKIDPNVIKSLGELHDSDSEVTINNKIDKETLSHIIGTVVKPKENKLNKETQPEKPEEKRGDRPEKEAATEDNKNIPASPVHQKNEKVITPKNFKKIKEIHPHEVVKVMPDEPKDLKEGEEIKFE